MDMRNIMKVKSVVYERPDKILSSFNLMAQIVPDREPFPNGQHYKTTMLDAGSLEYKVIHNLFTSTIAGGVGGGY